MKKTQLELDNMKARYQTFPEKYMPTTRKKKTRTNELTHLILEYCKSINAQAYRINSQGQYDPRLKTFRPSTQKKGLPDITIIYKGRFIGCEIKALKADKLSEYQIARKNEIEGSQGYYIEARTLVQFINDLKAIVTQINNGK
jgi:hypothetical protein